MSPQLKRRGIALAAVATAALFAVLYADPARDIVQPDASSRASAPESRRAAPSVARSAPVTDPDLARARQRFDPPDRTDSIEDLFAPRSWARPQPQPVAPPSEPPAAVQVKPEAPPLPYTYLGQLSEQGRTLVFLARDDVPVAGRVGEVLDGAYRIERISAAEVELTYLPLNTRQILSASPLQ